MSAKGSEQISTRWIKDASRECRTCGVKITNLAKQVGEVRHVFPGPRTDILCMDCHHDRTKGLKERLYGERFQERPESS